jgi:threonine dehydratase
MDARGATERLHVTPLERFGDVWLKREDVHELGAFKWRGALPTLERYRTDAVVTASTGNHGAATAWAAERLGMRAIVYVPRDVSAVKTALIERFGAELRPAGADLDEAKDEARAAAERDDLPFFEDGAEAAQYEGYGAIADEVTEQLGRPPAAVVVPVGNGALLGGIGTRLGAATFRVGVVAKDAPVMADSWDAGRPVAGRRCTTFAEGLAVRIAIPLAVEVLRDAADTMVRVSERAIAEAIGALARGGIRVEGAAAAGLAALRHVGPVDGPVVLVVTGRNIDDALWRRAVDRPESFSD